MFKNNDEKVKKIVIIKEDVYNFYLIDSHNSNCKCNNCIKNKSLFKSKYFKFN